MDGGAEGTPTKNEDAGENKTKEETQDQNKEDDDFKKDYIEMTVKLDTTMEKYEEDGGDQKFVKNVTSLLKIDKSLMKVMAKRSGSVYVTFRIKTDGSISVDDLKS